MKAILIAISMLLLGVVATVAYYHLRSLRAPQGPVVHVENGFEFTAHGPYKTVAPLFGAFVERVWADGWNPEFLHPSPARDTFGEVFTIAHSHLRSTWVNTAFDLESGHVQYVYVIPDTQAVLIDIHLDQKDPSITGVKVVYQRTALDPKLNDHISKLGEKDRGMGKEWETAIDTYLQANAKR
ncbi:MAG: hypothetical protein ABSF68_01180 [Candidatus Acidiferrales bacterium]